jgi:hypothetical protein
MLPAIIHKIKQENVRIVEDAPLLTGGKVYTQAYTLSGCAKTALLKNILFRTARRPVLFFS